MKHNKGAKPETNQESRYLAVCGHGWDCHDNSRVLFPGFMSIHNARDGFTDEGIVSSDCQQV